MSKLLLDSTVLIDVLRGNEKVYIWIEEARSRSHELFTTPINVDEIFRGLRVEDEDEVNGIEELFRWLPVAPLGKSEGEIAGTWRRQFAGKGITLDQGDCLIAACALSNDAAIATDNIKDFPMSELKLEHWPAGE